METKQPEDHFRQIGTTTRALKEAPIGAYYIWPVFASIDYPLRIARELGRTDLHIVTPSWLMDGWRGRTLSGIVVDHACGLTTVEEDDLRLARTRIVE